MFMGRWIDIVPLVQPIRIRRMMRTKRNNTKEIMGRFEPVFKSASLTSAKHTDLRYPAKDDMFEAKSPYQPPVLVTEYRLSD